MNKKLHFLFIPLSFLLCLMLYWPALQGSAIWDDTYFWFQDPALQVGTSTLHIWKNYAWPVSVGLQKFLLSVFHEKYLLYHLLGLGLHFLNSLMVFDLAKKLKINWAFLIYLIFLFHPTNVITIAWMIQLKTIICFSFAIGSILLLFKAKENPLFYIPSWLLFGASVLSKSASLPLFAILIFFFWKDLKSRKVLFLIPYLLFTLWGASRLLGSSVTQEGIRSVKLDEVKEIPKEAPSEVRPAPEPQPSLKPIEQVVAPTVEVAPVEKTPEIKKPLVNLSFIAKTLTYYFWQPLLPVENAPVKGINTSPLGMMEIIHMFFFIILVILSWKHQSLIYLLSAHILLLPFLGILPAPYMNVTWVSDQHLYLVLPALLFFWFSLLERVPSKKIYFVPALLLVFYMIQTMRATPAYKDEISFYEESLRFNPANVPVSYNLAVSYLQHKRINDAFNIVNTILYMGLEDPQIKNDQYFPQVVMLQMKLEKGIKK